MTPRLISKQKTRLGQKTPWEAVALRPLCFHRRPPLPCLPSQSPSPSPSRLLAAGWFLPVAAGFTDSSFSTTAPPPKNMQPRIRPWKFLYTWKFHMYSKPDQFKQNQSLIFIQQELVSKIRTFHNQTHQISENYSEGNCEFLPPAILTTDEYSAIDSKALQVQDLLKQIGGQKAVNEIEQAFTRLGLSLNEDLVLNVLRRNRSDWKPAYTFFNWVSNASGYSPGTGSYNEILDILGRMKRFNELSQLLDEMSKRNNSLISERTYGIVVNRYAAAHKIEEATEFFYKRIEFGLELDLVAFQTLLLSLCRYKHVEVAEFLFHSKKNEFRHNIKTMNIILNGWCVSGSLREAKRFWNDIITSKYKPDKFTYGIFINSLTKAGKISTAVKLFQAMWEKGCTPDVAICNCIIDGLCFKKRIPQALEIFREMNERDCRPDIATYNSLIKHLCKIRRMEKVDELLKEMKQKGGDCSPNARTYGYLLNSAKKPDEVVKILENMKGNGCKMMADTYNLMLRLFMGWDDEERVKSTWVEMERSGLGPDQRSYTVMVHGLYDKGRIEEAMSYYDKMTSKGMLPEPRTKLLVNAINIKLEDRDHKQS